MRKSNVIIAAVMLVVSAFLLWLWFHLGLNRVDEPLDLIVSVIWWVVVVVGVVAVARAERVRRERVRTVYLDGSRLYNSERGVAPREGDATGQMAALLGSLEYGFDRVEGPDPDGGSDRARWTHVVRTQRFEPGRGDDHDGETWEGEVVIVETGRSVPFRSRAELAAVIG